VERIPTGEGWLYLAAIKDMATREIVGWSIADHLKADLCVDALIMALQRCQARKSIDLSAGFPSIGSRHVSGGGELRHVRPAGAAAVPGAW
jgi:transposase InsO family protein